MKIGQMNTNELIIHAPCDPGHPPLSSVSSDWFGERMDPPARFSFSFENDMLAFRALRESEARGHPEAVSGHYMEGLWLYDVAEFFVSDPVTGRYLEVNLSPNGAHWACLFDAPRRRLVEINDSGAVSWGRCRQEGWEARVDVPLEWMTEHLHFRAETKLNVTFILDSPSQRFLSVADLGDGAPDFHRPDQFLSWRQERVSKTDEIPNQSHAPEERSAGQSKTGFE